MARRRNRVLGGVGEGMASIGEIWMQKLMADEQQQRMLERQTHQSGLISQRQDESEVLKKIIELLSSGQGHQVNPQMAQSLGGAFNIGEMTSPATLNADLSKEISGAQDLGKVPTMEDIIARYRGDKTPVLELAENEANEGELASKSFMPSQPRGIQDLLDQQGSKRNALTLENERGMDQKLAESYGTEYQQGMAQEDVEAQTHDANLARDVEHETATSEAQVLGRNSDKAIKAEAAKAYAVSGAQKRAVLAQDIIDKEVSRAGAIAGAETAARTANNAQTAANGNNVQFVVDTFKELSKEIHTQEGMSAYPQGLRRQLATKLGFDVPVFQYDNLREGLAIFLARAVGHVGNVAVAEQQMVQRLVPPVTASKPQAEAMFATLDKIVANVLKKRSGGSPGEFGAILSQAIAEAQQQGVTAPGASADLSDEIDIGVGR